MLDHAPRFLQSPLSLGREKQIDCLERDTLWRPPEEGESSKML